MARVIVLFGQATRTFILLLVLGLVIGLTAPTFADGTNPEPPWTVAPDTTVVKSVAPSPTEPDTTSSILVYWDLLLLVLSV